MTGYEVANQEFGVEGAGAELTESDLAALEGQLGVTLPAEMKKFYLHWNGGLPYPIEVPETKSVWVRLKWKVGTAAARVGPATSLGGLFRINSDPDTDLLNAVNDFRHRIPADCICFGNDPEGSLFLIGVGEHNYGRIYFWERSYEADVGAGESPTHANVADVADSFDEFLLALREEPDPGESLDDWVRKAYPEYPDSQ